MRKYIYSKDLLDRLVSIPLDESKRKDIERRILSLHREFMGKAMPLQYISSHAPAGEVVMYPVGPQKFIPSVRSNEEKGDELVRWHQKQARSLLREIEGLMSQREAVISD